MLAELASSRKSWIFLPSLVLALCGCGRETKFYSDPGTLGVSNIQPITIEPTSLPDGFFDQSVNDASVDVALDGTDAQTVALRLKTQATTNPVGGFNGSGTGNVAVLGNSRYSGKKLSAIKSITADTKTYVGSGTINIQLLTDLNCDGSSIRVLIANSTSLSPGTIAPAGYLRLDADFDSPIWKVSGAGITDPTNSSVTLIPSSTSADVGAIKDLIAKYPNACIRNANSGDSSLPKNLPTAGVLFTLGSDASSAYHGVLIRRITIGTDIYDYLQWGTK